jgi:hypothetical protein
LRLSRLGVRSVGGLLVVSKQYTHIRGFQADVKDVSAVQSLECLGRGDDDDEVRDT